MRDREDLMIPGRAGRLAVRTKGLANGPRDIVVLVQGANLSGQAGFDFQVQGRDDYSVMDALVARGLGAVTFAIRGYGPSEVPSDPLAIDTDAGIEDLLSVVEWLAARGHARPHIAGWSWGGRIVARFVERHPQHVARLALLDPALGGNRTGEPPVDPWFSGSWDWWYEGRLVTRFAEPEARKALADFVVAVEPRSPAGIRLENANGTIAAQPERIACPTLMLYGSEAARQDYMQSGVPRAEFFERLAARDKRFVVVPDCGDYAHLEIPRRRIQRELADFLLDH
jgi:pimeloyl-ACP methyl ester carboxylesterase